MKKKTEVIRGKRIQDQLDKLDEELYEVSTFTTLQQQAANVKHPENRARNAANSAIAISNVTYTPFVGMRYMEVKAVATNNSPQGREEKQGGITRTQYNPRIIFQQLTFEDEDTPENITVPGVDGHEYHLLPIDLNQSTVRVWCDCLDFRYRFQYYNAGDRSAYYQGLGKAGKRKGTGNWSVNDNRVPGVCKHLVALVADLKKARLIR